MIIHCEILICSHFENLIQYASVNFPKTEWEGTYI